MTTTPISLVVDDDPPLYYVARITQVYCCNCRESYEIAEPFAAHPAPSSTGVHIRPITHSTSVQYYNLPVRKMRQNPIPVPFCSECAGDETFKDRPKAPPRKARAVAPSWVGANTPKDYTIAGTIKHKEPKAKAPKAAKAKTYSLDDVD